MSQYAIGLDYGTNSCRSLLVDLETGEELGSVVFPYPSGTMGILTDPADPHVARQSPQDYLDGMVEIITGALAEAKEKRPDFDPAEMRVDYFFHNGQSETSPRDVAPFLILDPEELVE